MKTKWKNIVLLAFAIILIPATVLTVYEITSLDDSEEELRKVYDQQLETILFSVNQYSQDILSKWIEVLEISYNEVAESGNLEDLVSDIRSNPIFDNITFLNKKNGDIKQVVTGEGIFYESSGNKIIDDQFINWKPVIEKNREKIDRLINYKSSGYSKLEPIDFYDEDGNLFSSPQTTFMSFIIGRAESDFDIAIVQLNNKSVLQRILAPKIESMAQDQLVISIINKSQTRIIYSSNGDVNFMINNTKDVWILPGYALGISQAGTPIEEIISSRRTINVIIVLVFDFCILLAIWLIFSFLKKQEELSQHKSDFVSNVSHELRTPISLVKMYTESLEMGRVKEEKIPEYYSVINSETDRLSRIVNKILTFSRMDAGRKKFNFATTDLNHIVKKVMELYSHQMQELGYTFEIKLSEEKLLASLDMDSVEEAITNLIDNAIKYDTQNKNIIVSTGNDNSMGYFRITDKGIGIQLEDQKKIFEKFFRVSSGLVHNTKGSGLGLSLVKHIMDGHGGEVDVISQPGIGSTFTLLFPLDIKER